jgi:hypothetical protein
VLFHSSLASFCIINPKATIHTLLHAVGAFDALAQVRAKREQEYQVRKKNVFVHQRTVILNFFAGC